MRRTATFVTMLLVLLGAFVLPAQGLERERSQYDGISRTERAVRIALAQRGDPYRYGAAGPGAFDCSGLVYYSYRRAGISVPRTSDAQARYARRVSLSNKRRGDLIFYHSGGNVFHVAIYIGKGRVVEAAKPGTPVRVAPIWQQSRFAGRVR